MGVLTVLTVISMDSLDGFGRPLLSRPISFAAYLKVSSPSVMQLCLTTLTFLISVTKHQGN